MDQVKPTPKFTPEGRLDVRGLSDAERNQAFSALLAPFLRKLADFVETHPTANAADLEQSGLHTHGIGWVVTIPMLSDVGKANQSSGFGANFIANAISDHAADEWVRGQALINAAPSA